MSIITRKNVFEAAFVGLTAGPASYCLTTTHSNRSLGFLALYTTVFALGNLTGSAIYNVYKNRKAAKSKPRSSDYTL